MIRQHREGVNWFVNVRRTHGSKDRYVQLKVDGVHYLLPKDEALDLANQLVDAVEEIP